MGRRPASLLSIVEIGSTSNKHADPQTGRFIVAHVGNTAGEDSLHADSTF